MKKIFSLILIMLFTLILFAPVLLKLLNPDSIKGNWLNTYVGISFLITLIIVALSIEEWVKRILEIKD